MIKRRPLSGCAATSLLRVAFYASAFCFACFTAQAQPEQGNKELYLSVDVDIQHSVFESVALTIPSIEGVADVRFGYFITAKHFVGLLSSTNFFLQRYSNYNPVSPSVQLVYRYMFRTGQGRRALPFLGVSPGVVFADNSDIVELTISQSSYSAALQQIMAKYPDPTSFNAQVSALGLSLPSALVSHQVRQPEFSLVLEAGLKYFLSRRFAAEVAWRPTYQNLSPIYYQSDGNVILTDLGAAGFDVSYSRTGPETISTKPGEGRFNFFEKTKSTVAFGFSYLF